MLPAFYNSKDIEKQENRIHVESNESNFTRSKNFQPFKISFETDFSDSAHFDDSRRSTLSRSLTSVLLFPNIDCRRRRRRVLMTLLQIKTV